MPELSNAQQHALKFDSKHYDDAYRNDYDVERYDELYATLYHAAGEPDSVLDLGCGLGNFLGDWPDPKDFPGVPFPPKVRIGVDFSKVAIDKAVLKYSDTCAFICKSFVWFLQNRPSHVAYDVVFMCEVLEHLIEDAWMFNKAKSMVEHGGCIIVSVPYEERVTCRSHTVVRYNEDVARDRFGSDIEFIESYDEKFLVFKWVNQAHCEGRR